MDPVQRRQGRPRRAAWGVAALVAVLALLLLLAAGTTGLGQVGELASLGALRLLWGRQQLPWSRVHAEFRRSLAAGGLPDAAWLLQQPDWPVSFTAAVQRGQPGSAALLVHYGWAKSFSAAIDDTMTHQAYQGNAVVAYEEALQLDSSAAAAMSPPALGRALVCPMLLLQHAADFAAGLQDVEARRAAAAAHRSLMLTHLAFIQGESARTAVVRAWALLAAAAEAFGWQWGPDSGWLSLAQHGEQLLGEQWWQPLPGQQPCTEEWNLLRLLYQPARSGNPCVAERLESGQLGSPSWPQHLRAAAYGNSSAAEVALTAGELAFVEYNEPSLRLSSVGFLVVSEADPLCHATTPAAELPCDC